MHIFFPYDLSDFLAEFILIGNVRELDSLGWLPVSFILNRILVCFDFWWRHWLELFSKYCDEMSNSNKINNSRVFYLTGDNFSGIKSWSWLVYCLSYQYTPASDPSIIIIFILYHRTFQSTLLSTAADLICLICLLG